MEFLPPLKRQLDRAVDLVRAPAAWESMGGETNAGAGMKIGIVDTGIDQTHPMFSDSGFTAPAGFPKFDNSTNQAGDEQGDQYSLRHIEPVAVRTAAGGHPGPECERICGIGGNCRHADQQQGRKSHKAATARDRIQSPAQDAGHKKKNGLLRA